MASMSSAVGIDLGTTFSLIAYLDEHGKPKTIANCEGDLITPSVVLFDGSSVVVGKEAVKAAGFEPEKVAQFVKREMGSGGYSKVINGEQIPPEVIQSFILEKLKRDAESVIGPIKKVVITVPAYFNEPCRKATQDAGHLAGLDVMDIINEPTAAAIAFGMRAGFVTESGESKRLERILVYDLGGGTFDVTMMEIDGKQYVVKATAGDVFLGGIDWDQRLVDHVAEQFMKKFQDDDPRQNPTSLQRLLREAEDAKRALTARESTTISFEHSGHRLQVPITRREFEKLTGDLLERTRFTTSSVLKDAGVAWNEITRLLLVGGSSRMPMVREMLERESGQKVDCSLSFDEAVAHGAAIYAGLLLASEDGAIGQSAIKNVNAHNLGVLGIEAATNRPRNSTIISRNTPLPVTKRSRFSTQKADQRNVVVKVVEGGDASGNGSTAIGKCVVRQLPPGLPARTPVDVTFTYAENGRLTVSANLPGLKQKAILSIERESGLSDASLQDWEQKLRNGSGPLKLK